MGDMRRFISKTIVNDNGCIDWTDSLATNGYGKFLLNKKEIMAHRAAWLLFMGDIPKGMHILHSCDRPSCVNIKHLRLGTHNDNMSDMQNRGRVNKTVKHTKLNAEQVREIRDKYKKGIHKLVLAKEYGVHRSNIHLIVTRKAWEHIL